METAPQLQDPTGQLGVWFTDPPGMLDALHGSHMTNAMVDWLTGPATHALLARFPGTRLRFLHDWRRARSYDLTARAKLVAWGLGLGRAKVHSITIGLSPETPAIVRMACHAGVVPFAMAGITMGVEEDWEAALLLQHVRVLPR